MKEVCQNNTTSYRTKSPHECVCPGDQYCHVAHGWIPVTEDSFGELVGVSQVRESFQNPPESVCCEPKATETCAPANCKELTTEYIEPTDRLKELEIERGKVYGPPNHAFTNIGLSWTGILQQHYGIILDHPIPNYLACQMMAAFKNQRSVRVFHQDNYDDGRVYLDMACRLQQGKD